MNRIDRNEVDRENVVKVAVLRDILAAVGLQAHFDLEFAAFAHRGDVHVAAQHFHVVVGLNLRRSDFA